MMHVPSHLWCIGVCLHQQAFFWLWFTPLESNWSAECGVFLHKSTVEKSTIWMYIYLFFHKGQLRTQHTRIYYIFYWMITLLDFIKCKRCLFEYNYLFWHYLVFEMYCILYHLFIYNLLILVLKGRRCHTK